MRCPSFKKEASNVAKKYIAVRPLTVYGKDIKPGKQVVGLEKRKLNALVEHGSIKIVEEEPRKRKKDLEAVEAE